MFVQQWVWAEPSIAFRLQASYRSGVFACALFWGSLRCHLRERVVKHMKQSLLLLGLALLPSSNTSNNHPRVLTARFSKVKTPTSWV